MRISYPYYSSSQNCTDNFMDSSIKRISSRLRISSMSFALFKLSTDNCSRTNNHIQTIDGLIRVCEHHRQSSELRPSITAVRFRFIDKNRIILGSMIELMTIILIVKITGHHSMMAIPVTLIPNSSSRPLVRVWELMILGTITVSTVTPIWLARIDESYRRFEIA